MWLNVRGFDAALTEEAAWRMTAGAIATSASAVVLLVIAIAHYSFGRRGSRVGATLFALAVFASLALPLAARGRAVDLRPPISPVLRFGTGPRGRREPGTAGHDAAARRRLARLRASRVWRKDGCQLLARLLEKAAVMDLATVRPTQPDPVWAAVATGMYPSKNGVRSAAVYYARDDSRPVDLLPDHCFSHALVHLGFIRDQPNAATTWRARPLWSIASQAGVQRRDCALAAHVSRGARERVHRDRSISSAGRIDRRIRSRRLASGTAAGQLEATFCGADPDGAGSRRRPGSALRRPPRGPPLAARPRVQPRHARPVGARCTRA